MEEKLISVIVPVYNGEDYLDRCIESIVNQTYKNLEIIIINDGSTDNSVKISSKWEKKDKRIKNINQKNKGVSATRNKGIDLCKGEYITFIDCDDYICNDYIETLYNEINLKKYDVVISNAIIISNGKETPFNNIKTPETLTSEIALKKMLAGRYFQTVCWGKLYKTSLIKKIRFNEKMKIAEDLDFLLRVFEKSSKVLLTNHYKYYYVIRNDSTVRTLSTKTFDEFNYCNEVIEKYKNTSLEKYAIKHYVNVNISYAFNYDLNKENLKQIKSNIKKYKKYYSIFSDASRNEKVKYKLVMYFYPLVKKVL